MDYLVLPIEIYEGQGPRKLLHGCLILIGVYRKGVNDAIHFNHLSFDENMKRIVLLLRFLSFDKLCKKKVSLPPIHLS